MRLQTREMNAVSSSRASFGDSQHPEIGRRQLAVVLIEYS